MHIKRRIFIQTSAAAGAMGIMTQTAHAFTMPDPPRKATLKLSCQEGVAPEGSLAEKLDFLEKNGFAGFEVGGGNLSGRVSDLQKALKGRAIKISAICAGFKGVIISEQEPIRRQAMDSMKEILTAAGELNSTGLIIVPAFNNQTKLGNLEARPILVDLLKELGEHAVNVKSRILLEPLNRKEAFFLRQVADAAAICRDVGSPGISCMGDFWHMTWEETSDLGAILSAGTYLHHMHIASRKRRKMPGEDEGDNYVDGFRGLKLLGYQDYVSFECGSVGDKKATIPAAAKLLREQWEKA
ncbi:MAG: sugar phosphate isomerase/epimerase [Candidatus Latescibacter sp.]|nr:sugar phosphate isomerase/epimerase [Candidatus Latescibacter sp.]